MSICPVCGCKTDELDFKACFIEGKEEKVCSFCENQIKKFNSGEEPALAQLRWLKSVIEKDIPARENDTLKALLSLDKKFSNEQPSVPVQSQNKFSGDTPAKQKNALTDVKADINEFKQVQTLSGDEKKQIEALTKRLEHLEKSFAKYKKTQTIKMIVELMVPVILLIITLIVFFASGLFDTLSSLTDLSNMM